MDEAKAVSNLRDNPDFLLFMQALGKYAETLNEQLINNEKLNLLRMQGQTQAATRILTGIVEARETYEKLTER